MSKCNMLWMRVNLKGRERERKVRRRDADGTLLAALLCFMRCFC